MADAQSLAEYLAARYDEAEAKADAVFGFWRASPNGNIVDTSYSAYIAVGPNGKGIDRASRDHILAYDPEWAIRDITLKRAILTEHRPDEYDPDDCRSCRRPEPGWARGVPAETPCAAVRQLGTEFCKRPDYREEWKPARVIGDVSGKLLE